MARALVASVLLAASLGIAPRARAADPPAPVTGPTRPGDLSSGGAPARGDEGTLRTGEPPKRLERVESENRPPPSVRFPTIVGGVTLSAALWGLGSATAYAFPDDPGMKDLRTPVVGPWMAISNNECDGGCSIGAVARYVWFAVNGIGQAGGIAIALEGVFVRTGSAEAPAPAPFSPRPSPALPPEAAPPAEPGGGKPLFFLPLPAVVGRDGVGVGWGGIF